MPEDEAWRLVAAAAAAAAAPPDAGSLLGVLESATMPVALMLAAALGGRALPFGCVLTAPFSTTENSACGTGGTA